MLLACLFFKGLPFLLEASFFKGLSFLHAGLFMVLLPYPIFLFKESLLPPLLSLSFASFSFLFSKGFALHIAPGLFHLVSEGLCTMAVLFSFLGDFLSGVANMFGMPSLSRDAPLKFGFSTLPFFKGSSGSSLRTTWENTASSSWYHNVLLDANYIHISLSVTHSLVCAILLCGSQFLRVRSSKILTLKLT